MPQSSAQCCAFIFCCVECTFAFCFCRPAFFPRLLGYCFLFVLLVWPLPCFSHYSFHNDPNSMGEIRVFCRKFFKQEGRTRSAGIERYYNIHECRKSFSIQKCLTSTEQCVFVPLCVSHGTVSEQISRRIFVLGHRQSLFSSIFRQFR